MKVTPSPACSRLKLFSCRETGLTMIELMVTIVLIVLLSAFSYPSIVRWGANYRLRSAASDLMTNIHFARMEAIKRNQNVVIAYDNGADSYTISDVNGTILQMNMPQDVGLAAALSGGANATTFTPRGLPNFFGNVSLINNNLNLGYRVVYGITGMARLEKSTDGGSTWQNYP